MPCENYFVSFPLLGVIISKVHEIYSLTQKSYLKDFINTNIEAKKKTLLRVTQRNFIKHLVMQHLEKLN